ncbi:MAG: hypothetical protein R3F02_03270 [Thiolinea sp.]
MRTTLTIDDDIFAAARYIAQQKKLAVGVVLSDLARRGLQKTPELGQRNNFPVFRVSEHAAPITPEQVKMLDDDE